MLGETHVFSAKGYYWGIWVNNQFATAGICDLKLHRGEQLLFAPAPASGTVHPTAIKAPATAKSGSPFTVKVSYYNAKGRSKPLSGARDRRRQDQRQRRGQDHPEPRRQAEADRLGQGLHPFRGRGHGQ